VAASILVAAYIGGWFLLQRHNEALIAQTVVLDLRTRALLRGTEANPTEPALVVDHAAKHWSRSLNVILERSRSLWFDIQKNVTPAHFVALGQPRKVLTFLISLVDQLNLALISTYSVQLL
jgi:hypothetical protein